MTVRPPIRDFASVYSSIAMLAAAVPTTVTQLAVALHRAMRSDLNAAASGAALVIARHGRRLLTTPYVSTTVTQPAAALHPAT